MDTSDGAAELEAARAERRRLSRRLGACVAIVVGLLAFGYFRSAGEVRTKYSLWTCAGSEPTLFGDASPGLKFSRGITFDPPSEEAIQDVAQAETQCRRDAEAAVRGLAILGGVPLLLGIATYPRWSKATSQLGRLERQAYLRKYPPST